MGLKRVKSKKPGHKRTANDQVHSVLTYPRASDKSELFTSKMVESIIKLQEEAAKHGRYIDRVFFTK